MAVLVWTPILPAPASGPKVPSPSPSLFVLVRLRAPRRDPSIGVFRLTEPEGMKLIQECKLKGFHVHPEGVKIYEEVPLEWSSRLPVKLVDLR